MRNGISLSRRVLLSSAVVATAAMAMPGIAMAQDASLRVAWWGGVDRNAKFEEIFDAWSAENPDVEIIPEPAEWGAYWDRFATQSIAGTLPDVFGMTERQVNVYSDLMLDLTPYIEDGRLDLSAYDEVFVDAGMVDGKFLMLNTGMTIPALLYNKPMFEKAGLEMPEQMSLSEYRDLAVELGEAEGGPEWGASDDGGQVLGFDTFLRQRGKKLFTNEGLGFEEADWAEWLAFWEEMRQAGAVPPAAVTAEVQGAPQSDMLIARSRVGMMLVNHNKMPTLEKYTGGELGVALQPIVEGGEPIALMAGTYWGVHADSENPDAAVEFLDFFINNEDAVLAYAAELGALPSATGRDILAPTLDEANKALFEFTTAAFPYADVAGPRDPSSLQVEAFIGRSNQDVANGRETPESAAATYFAQAQSLMSR